MRLAYKAKRALEEAVKASGTVVDGQFIFAVGKNDAIVAASQNLTLDPQHHIGERDVGRIRREMFGSVRKPKAKPEDPDAALKAVRHELAELNEWIGRVSTVTGRDVLALAQRLSRLETDLGVKPPPLPVAHSGADR